MALCLSMVPYLASLAYVAGPGHLAYLKESNSLKQETSPSGLFRWGYLFGGCRLSPAFDG